MRIFLFICISTIFLNGQQELATYFFQGLHQSSELNPAFDADQKLVIGLPSAFLSFNQEGLSINKLLKGDVLPNLSDRRNQLMFGSNLSMLKVSYKRKKIRYNFAHNYRSFSDLQYSNPLVVLLVNGNESLIGGTATFTPDFESTWYSETVFGAAYTGKFSFGANLKLVNGIQDLSTERTKFELSVNDDIYQLSSSADVLLNSSFPIDLEDLNISQFSLFSFIPQNFGLAFDLGLSYINGRFSFAISALDLGFVNWNEDPHNYEIKGDFAFKGVALNEILDGNFELLDTLGGSFSAEDLRQSYSNYVPSKIYANVNYQIRSDIQLGGLIYGHSNFGRLTAALALNIQKSWRSKHAISLQYAVIGDNLLNFGISGYTTLGPVQVYAMCDNFLAWSNTLGAQYSNLRLGINIAIDRKSKSDNSGYANF